MHKLLTLMALLLVIAITYFALWPVPVDPLVWQPSVNPGYTGSYSVNHRLERFEPLSMNAMTGPEAAVVASNGDVVATSHEGWLVRFKDGNGSAIPWVELGGRPLGLDIDAEGNVWVANAYLGLQKITPQGLVSVALDSIDGEKILYADDVSVLKSGKIVFSDATTRFSPKDWGGTLAASVLDIIEHGKTGRIIEYDPISKHAEVVLSGLSFANGVAADPAGQFILVNETGEYRVWKFWLNGLKKGTKEVLLSGLPGFPDNIAAGRNGVFWLGLVGPRSADIDNLASDTFARKVSVRLPDFMKPSMGAYGMVLGISGEGQVIHNLQAPSGKLYATTGLLETENDVYVSSLTVPFLAKITKEQAGL